MLLPPKEVPEDVSAEEYERLSVLYMLMGRTPEAAQASARAASAKNVELSPEMSQQEAMAAGAAFAGQLVELLKRRAEEKSSGKEMDTKKELSDLFAQFKSLGVNEDAIDALTKDLEKQLDESDNIKLSRDLPTGLNAEEYYDLGVKYKYSGWTEQARDALAAAMEADPDGEVGRKAQLFLRTKIPRHPVPLVAEQLNVKGFNLMAAGDIAAAKQLFIDLTRQYPDFEWPWGNLGSLYIMEGDLQKAEETLIHAVQLSPFYVNGWLHLMRANTLASKFEQARYCIKKVREIDPDEGAAEQFASILEQVSNW
jgi:tetratricopeptide (TPR) repeat protein